MPAFSVTRKTTIQAPIDQVFAALRDFKQWPTWSPWLICEPDCALEFAADGNSYSWEGNVVGAGSIAVVSEDADKSLELKLTFLKPWKSTADVDFQLSEVEGGVEVAWTMNSALPFFMFWMKSMMIALMKFDYDRGLGMLKSLLETGSVPSTLEFVGQQTFPAFTYIGVKSHVKIAEVGPSMERDVKKVIGHLKELAIEPTCAPFAIYHKWDMVKGEGTYTLGFPVAEAPASLPEDLISGNRAATEVYSVKHTGPYDFAGNPWAAVMMRAQNKVIAQNKKIEPIETYMNSPVDTPANELETIVHMPVK